MGVSLPTVDKWQREGCPVEGAGGRGRAFKFNLPDVLQWWQDRERENNSLSIEKATEAELRRRKLAAETGEAELKFAKAKGEVALIEEFQRAQQNVMGLIRANIMNVPARAVLQLLGETDESIFKRKLRAELALALKQAAEADVSEDFDEEFDEEDEM